MRMKRKDALQSKKGFSLVELIICVFLAVIIIAVIVAIVK